MGDDLSAIPKCQSCGSSMMYAFNVGTERWCIGCLDWLREYCYTYGRRLFYAHGTFTIEGGAE